MDTMGGGTVDDRTAAEAAAGMRSVLAAIDEGQLSCSTAYRNRLQSAAAVLEILDQTSFIVPPEYTA
jgi:hypothetical protein